MRRMKLSMALGLAMVVGGLLASQSQAQVVVVGPAIGPRIIPRMIVPAPVAVLPGPSVVTAYRPPITTYVAPTAAYSYSYSTYRPVVPAPVLSPVFVTRPAVVRPGIGGFPNVYIRGQPVRNAMRFLIP